MLDSLVDDKAIVGAQESPDDVRKGEPRAPMVAQSGNASWRRYGKRRRWQRVCPDLQQVGWEALDVEEWGGWELELRWSGDGVEWAASRRVRREPRARGAGATRRLGETTRRTRLELHDPLGVSMSTIM